MQKKKEKKKYIFTFKLLFCPYSPLFSYYNLKKASYLYII